MHCICVYSEKQNVFYSPNMPGASPKNKIFFISPTCRERLQKTKCFLAQTESDWTRHQVLKQHFSKIPVKLVFVLFNTKIIPNASENLLHFKSPLILFKHYIILFSQWYKCTLDFKLLFHLKVVVALKHGELLYLTNIILNSQKSSKTINLKLHL